jgi:hypothetical protein
MGGTMAIDKAEVSGAEVTEQDKSKLDLILEKMEADQAESGAQFRLIDVELSSEIVGTLRGHFSENLIYNIPRRSSSGKTEHRECERMKGGCPYKGQKHIHIVGVGYQGALTAMRAYGRMAVKVEDIPDMVEQGNKLYWAAYGDAIDRHTGNELGRWYLEPVMRKAGGRYIENEFGASIAQSKALRNVILALIPAKLMEGWIEDYKAGKQAFDVQRAKNMGYGPEPQKEAPERERKERTKTKGNVKTPGERDLESVTEELAEQLCVEAEELSAFGSVQYDTQAKAMLGFNRALSDDILGSDISRKFTAWKSKQEQSGEESEAVEMDLALEG